ncbi:MAG TPA: glycoside hydrolase family 15 protein [Solirubrobacteraceae bacterium]|nr:glycoside hydrolase family 15 protein [Solirubrobacteraceae bacterium]
MIEPCRGDHGGHPDRPHALREYALLADGERGILVGPDGGIAWMCFPRWDSSAVFPGLIGGAGGYTIAPPERFVWGGYYEPGSLIWRSRWVTTEATIECREALALPSRHDRAVLLRRVVAVSGTATLEVTLDLRGDYGERPPRELRKRDDGAWSATLGDTRVCWTGAEDAVARAAGDGGQALGLRLELAEGEHHDYVLVLDGSGEAEPPAAERAWEQVASEWRRRVPEMPCTVAPRDARHACAVLTGLTSATGAMVAAATTSLPEHARQGRSYDYRYAWIRDQCYAGEAAARAGPLALMDDAVRFISARLLEDGPRMRPAYTTTGAEVPDPRRLNLPGYPGGTDIVGNHANAQFQLDAFGEALLLFAAAARHDHLDGDGWRAAHAAVDAITTRWNESGSDAGIWELDPDDWTHSRLICVAGLRAIARSAPRGRPAEDWLELAQRVLADTATHATHHSGRWQRSRRDQRLDAALLLAPVRGALSHEDERSTATLAAVAAELTEDGFCYRFRPDDQPLGKAEGAFLLCGFWMCLAYVQQGDRLSASRWFERNRSACGPPGMLAEEYDVRQRQLRGNLPQAFVHALLLECAAAQYELVA